MGTEYHYIPSISIAKLNTIDYTITYNQILTTDTNTNYYDFSTNGVETISIYADNTSTQKLNNKIYSTTVTPLNNQFTINYRLLSFGNWAFYAVTTTENIVPDYLIIGTALNKFNIALNNEINALTVLNNADISLNDASQNYLTAITKYNTDYNFYLITDASLNFANVAYFQSVKKYDDDYAFYLITDASLNFANVAYFQSVQNYDNDYAFYLITDTSLNIATNNYFGALGVYYTDISNSFNIGGTIDTDIKNYYTSVQYLIAFENYQYALRDVTNTNHYLNDMSNVSMRANDQKNTISSVNTNSITSNLNSLTTNINTTIVGYNVGLSLNNTNIQAQATAINTKTTTLKSNAANIVDNRTQVIDDIIRMRNILRNFLTGFGSGSIQTCLNNLLGTQPLFASPTTGLLKDSAWYRMVPGYGGVLTYNLINEAIVYAQSIQVNVDNYSLAISRLENMMSINPSDNIYEHNTMIGFLAVELTNTFAPINRDVINKLQILYGIMRQIYQYHGDQQVTDYSPIADNILTLGMSFALFHSAVYLSGPNYFDKILNGNCSDNALALKSTAESFTNLSLPNQAEFSYNFNTSAYNNLTGSISDLSNNLKYILDEAIELAESSKAFYNSENSLLANKNLALTTATNNLTNINGSILDDLNSLPKARANVTTKYNTLMSDYTSALTKLSADQVIITSSKSLLDTAITNKNIALATVNNDQIIVNNKKVLLDNAIINKGNALATLLLDQQNINVKKLLLDAALIAYNNALLQLFADQTDIFAKKNALDIAYNNWAKDLSDYNVKYSIMMDLSANLDIAVKQELQADCNAKIASNLQETSSMSYALFSASCSAEPTNPIQRMYDPQFVNTRSIEPPNPPNLWSRASLSCVDYNVHSQEELAMRRKAETLQHKGNQNPLTKKQKLSRNVNGNGPLAKKVWATQNDLGSNPNVFNLPQVGNTLILCPDDNTNNVKCEPSSASDVPGNSVLCYDPAVPLVNYIAPQSTYLAGGTKWPQSTWQPGDDGFPRGKKGMGMLFQ